MTSNFWVTEGQSWFEWLINLEMKTDSWSLAPSQRPCCQFSFSNVIGQKLTDFLARRILSSSTDFLYWLPNQCSCQLPENIKRKKLNTLAKNILLRKVTLENSSKFQIMKTKKSLNIIWIKFESIWTYQYHRRFLFVKTLDGVNVQIWNH